MRMTRDTEALVAEMGMNHFGELSRQRRRPPSRIWRLSPTSAPRISSFSARVKGICKAKLEILEGLQEGGAAVLCGDEPLLVGQNARASAAGW